MLTLGVDAARGGWIAVALDDGRFALAALERRFPALLERFEEAVIVGVDVPIGLPKPNMRRRADVEARKLVGARRSSIFFTPCRAALQAPTYREAREVAPSTSAQGWALRTAILDVDRVRDARVHEVHPEVSFAVLAGRPAGPSPSRSAPGTATANGCGSSAVPASRFRNVWTRDSFRPTTSSTPRSRRGRQRVSLAASR